MYYTTPCIKVQRVAMAAFGVRVDGTSSRGLWPPDGGRLCPHRGNDSLHFVRRSAPSKCVRCASLRSGGRRLAVRTAMGNHIGAMPRTPFPASRDFPSRGNERYEGKKQRVIYFRYHFGVFPLWWLAPPPFPRKRGHYGCLAMEPCLCRKA